MTSMGTPNQAVSNDTTAAGGGDRRVVINVGGTEFSSSKTTLVASSTYFQSLFSNNWNSMETSDGNTATFNNNNIRNNDTMSLFIDQDPDDFRVFLSYMRLGKVQAKLLSPTVLLQAQYLGIEKLLEAVRLVAQRDLVSDEDTAILKSATSAGLLDEDSTTNIPIQKEYAILKLHRPEWTRFDGEYKNMEVWGRTLVASIEVIEKSTESQWRKVKAYTSFIDGLNWMQSNKFSHFEEMLTLDSQLHKSILCNMIFPRLKMTEDTRYLISTIISDECRISGPDEREFACFVQFKSDYRQGMIYIEIASGDWQEKRVLGVGSGKNAKVRAQKIHDWEDGYDITLNTWLQRKGFIRREAVIEKIYHDGISRSKSTFQENHNLPNFSVALSGQGQCEIILRVISFGIQPLKVHRSCYRRLLEYYVFCL